MKRNIYICGHWRDTASHCQSIQQQHWKMEKKEAEKVMIIMCCVEHTILRAYRIWNGTSRRETNHVVTVTVWGTASILVCGHIVIRKAILVYCMHWYRFVLRCSLDALSMYWMDLWQKTVFCLLKQEMSEWFTCLCSLKKRIIIKASLVHSERSHQLPCTVFMH